MLKVTLLTNTLKIFSCVVVYGERYIYKCVLAECSWDGIELNHKIF